MVTMAVPSTMELTNVLTLSCSTSSLWMTRGLLTTASYGRNGGAELPPPPRRYALSKPGYLPSSICHTMLSSTRTSPGRKRLWRVTNGQGSAHCRRAMDTVGAGVRSQLGEDAVAAEGASDRAHEVVVAVAGSGQLGETAAPVVDSG